jgi:hypothetical protein
MGSSRFVVDDEWRTPIMQVPSAEITVLTMMSRQPYKSDDKNDYVRDAMREAAGNPKHLREVRFAGMPCKAAGRFRCTRR